MIKCFSYSRLLKLSFSILLIGFFGLLGVSSVNSYYCNSDNTYCNDLLFGETLDNVGGQAGYVGAVSDNNLNFKAYYFSYRKQGVELFNLWWEQSNLGYAMQGNGYIPRNGKFNNYVVCSSMPTENDKFILNKNGCNSYTVGDTMKFKLIDNNRYLFNCVDNSMNPVSCYVCSYKDGGNEYICLDDTLGYNIVNTFLTGGQVLTLAKRNPYSDNIYNNMQGPVEIQPGNNLTGDYVYSSVSYGEIWDYLENKLGYSKFLCYGGIDNFNTSSGGVSPIPGTGKNIMEILQNWNNPDNHFFTFWNGLYGGFPDMWASYPYVYKTWFDFYYQYGGANYKFDEVYNYCLDKYILGINPDSKYVGETYSWIRNNILVEKRSSLVDSGFAVGVNRNGIGNNTGSGSDKNAVVYIQDFFNLLKENFPTKYDLGFGLLPAYIITFMLALILFRFISH